MTMDLLRIVVQAFGVLIILGALWGLVSPPSLIGIVRKVAANPGGVMFAVAIRVLLGASLLTLAQNSRFPVAFMALGWVAILAAVGLLIMGQKGMQRLVNFVGRWSPTTIRVWLVFGVLFAAFLIYGAS